MGGKGGGKGAVPQDNTMQMYQMQQMQLAQEKAEQEAKEKAQQQAEQERRDKLREQMLGSAISTQDDEEDTGDLAIQKNTLS